eukprot:COSAG05_NODE_10840_length_543_cov_1.058559_1_plen_178_part_10
MLTSHAGLVIFRMHVNHRKGAISADARWREDQEWFVAMTFNSYMMLFAFFWLNEPFKMFKKQKKNFDIKVDCTLKTEACDDAAEVGGQIPVGSVFTAFSAYENGREPEILGEGEAEWLHVEKLTLPGQKRPKRLSKSQEGWIPKSMVETRWKRRKLGLLGVFARIGKGGAWDLAASYV